MKRSVIAGLVAVTVVMGGCSDEESNTELYLPGREITDEVLAEKLQGLTKLEKLWLNNTKVTDAGLVHIRKFTQL